MQIKWVLGLFILCIGNLWAGCHDVVEGRPYPPPQGIKVDRLCINENDFFSLFNEGQEVYSFQSVLKIINFGYRCWRHRDGNEECGDRIGDYYLNYSDSMVQMRIQVDPLMPEGNMGAQFIRFQNYDYKFWVKGRR